MQPNFLISCVQKCWGVFIQDSLKKTLDPGLRRDDIRKAVGPKVVIPAQAGIQ